MTSPISYDGSCFCGAVQFTVTGSRSAWAIVIVILAAIGRRLPLMPSPVSRVNARPFDTGQRGKVQGA